MPCSRTSSASCGSARARECWSVPTIMAKTLSVLTRADGGSCGAMWAATYVLVGYAAGKNLAVLQRHWASASTVLQIAVAIAIVTFVCVRCARARWLRVAVGAALLALFAVRATTLMLEDLQPVTVPVNLKG